MRTFPHVGRRIAVCLLLCLGVVISGCATTGKSLSKAERAQILLEIGNNALLEGDPTGALNVLYQAEAEDPKLADIYHSKALAFYAKADLQTAIAQVKRALELRPEFSEAQNTYGKFLIDDGKPDEAIAPLMKAAKNPLNREAFKAHTNLGIIFYRKNVYSRALEHMNAAIREQPMNACVAYYYRGHIHLKKSEVKEAIHDYDKATRRFCVNFPDAHLALGIAYEHGKQYVEARKKFLQIQEMYPDTRVAEQAVSRLKGIP